jgi:hypothetical protein
MAVDLELAPKCSGAGSTQRRATPPHGRRRSLARGQFEAMLADESLVDIEIRETHRVHEHAGSAIVRARKPPT